MINEASFQLFVNSLGGDRTSSHCFDNWWAARAVLGRRYVNEFIVKLSPLPPPRLRGGRDNLRLPFSEWRKKVSSASLTPLSCCWGVIFNACRILCLQSKACLEADTGLFCCFPQALSMNHADDILAELIVLLAWIIPLL